MNTARRIFIYTALVVAFLLAMSAFTPTWAQQNQPQGAPTSNLYAKGMLSADSALRAARQFKVYPYFDSTGQEAVVGHKFFYHNGIVWKKLQDADSAVTISQLGVPNGVATLDISGTLTSSQIPAGLVGAVIYKGVWNANTNNPTLASGVGTNGWYYIVDTAGSTTLDGISTWAVKDIAIFNGAVWNKISGAGNDVLSVFGRVGAVVAMPGDYTAADVNAVPAGRNITINSVTQSLITDRTWTVGDILSSGTYADPTWITSLAYSKITGGTSSQFVKANGSVDTNHYVALSTFAFAGGTITAIPTNGQTINSSDVIDWIRKAFYPTQAPTAALTVTYSATTSSAIQLEKMSSGADLSVTLNWTAGRQATTATLASIVVYTVSQTFTQPSQPGSTSGTQAGTVVRNTNKTFTNTVTTTDSKVASASATVQFFTKFYYGFVSSSITAPSDGDIQGLTQFFNTSRTQSNHTSTPSGSQKLVISFDAALDPGNISTIWIGGIDQTASFTRTVRSFTNASGFTYSEIIYIENSPTSAAITFQIQ